MTITRRSFTKGAVALGSAAATGALSMPAFGAIYSDAEVAAVANYVTARFGAKGAQLKEQDVAGLRKQTMQ